MHEAGLQNPSSPDHLGTPAFLAQVFSTVVSLIPNGWSGKLLPASHIFLLFHSSGQKPRRSWNEFLRLCSDTSLFPSHLSPGVLSTASPHPFILGCTLFYSLLAPDHGNLPSWERSAGQGPSVCPRHLASAASCPPVRTQSPGCWTATRGADGFHIPCPSQKRIAVSKC